MAEGARFVHGDDPMSIAGERLASALRAVMYESELVRLAVPGGSALAALGVAREALGAEFERVQLTWVDERRVVAADPASNRGAAERAGHLGPANAPREIVPLYLDDETPEAAVARAREALHSSFDSALDVTLLGLGEDGHVASLFPGRFDREDDQSVVAIDDAPKPPPERVSLGWRMLATARETIVAASGEAKRDAIARTRAGDASLPAVGLHGVLIVSDVDASA